MVRARTSALGISPATDLLTASGLDPQLKFGRGISTSTAHRRNSQRGRYLKADRFAVCVPPPAGLRGLPQSSRQAVATTSRICAKAARVLEGDNAGAIRVDFVRRIGVTRVVLAKPAKRPIPFLTKKNIVMDDGDRRPASRWLILLTRSGAYRSTCRQPMGCSI